VVLPEPLGLKEGFKTKGDFAFLLTLIPELQGLTDHLHGKFGWIQKLG